MFDKQDSTSISPTIEWECIYTFICEHTRINGVAITPDGKTLVSGNNDKILIHDLDTGKVWKIPNFTQDVLEIQKAETQLEKEDYFKIETIEDARERSYASIVRRRGQKAFREKLLAAYNNQCAVTDCDAEQALEAAHIYPYKGDDTNEIWNGLILRSDIHTLFDLYLLTIDPEEKTVCLAPTLKNTTYRELDLKKIRLPDNPQLHPHKEVLIWHYKQCKWTNC